jgi:hypothetical protein
LHKKIVGRYKTTKTTNDSIYVCEYVDKLFMELDLSLWIDRTIKQHFFNTEELVVFCDAVSAAGRAGFDLPAI